MEYIRRKLRAKDVHDCFEVLLYFGRWTLIIPFYITRVKDNFTTSLHIPALIYMVLGLVLYFISFFFVIIYNETLIGHIYTSLIFKFSDKFRLLMSFICMAYIFIDGFLDKNFFGNIVEMYTKIDHLFKLLGVNKSYNKIKRKMILWSILFQLLNLVYTLLSLWLVSLWTLKPSFFMCIAMFSSGYVITGVLAQFRGNILFICKNLKIINNQLSTMLDRNRKNVAVKVLSNDAYNDMVKSRLHIIMKIFDTTCQGADLINCHFTKSILVIMATSFLSTVFNMFYVFTTLTWLIKGNDTFKLKTFLIFSIHQCVLHACNIILAVNVCESCQSKAKKTSILINKMLIEENDNQIKKKLHYFSTYMLHRYPRFSACGFFTMDNTLFFTMVGASTTYLIILIQFTLTSSFEDKLVNSTGLINFT